MGGSAVTRKTANLFGKDYVDHRKMMLRGSGTSAGRHESTLNQNNVAAQKSSK